MEISRKHKDTAGKVVHGHLLYALRMLFFFRK